MPIKVPKNERQYEQPRERKRTAKDREFGESLREAFSAKAAKRREKQEARGIPSKAPVNGKSPAAEEVERIGRKLAEL